jgi:hypothetical protein
LRRLWAALETAAMLVGLGYALLNDWVTWPASMVEVMNGLQILAIVMAGIVVAFGLFLLGAVIQSQFQAPFYKGRHARPRRGKGGQGPRLAPSPWRPTTPGSGETDRPRNEEPSKPTCSAVAPFLTFADTPQQVILELEPPAAGSAGVRSPAPGPTSDG